MQIHPDDSNWGREREALTCLGPNKGRIGLGSEDDKNWTAGERIVPLFRDRMQIGDIVAVRTGQTPVALVSVLSDSQEGPEEDLLWFSNSREVHVLDWYSPEDDFIIPVATGTLMVCSDTSKPTSKIIIGWYERIMNNEEMITISNLLKLKKQVILQGAPGVGKTYATKEVALRILGETKFLNRVEIKTKYKAAVERGQIVFVTFHQSMDYEDFVEGYKPVESGDGTPCFELRDGPFKKIVSSCIGSLSEQVYNDVWNNLIDSFDATPRQDVPYLNPRTNRTFPIWLGDNDTVYCRPPNNESVKFKRTKKRIWNCITKDVSANTYELALIQYLKDNYQLPANDFHNTRKPHVLIIDEINRGNVSKIFGELITALETDKREADPSMPESSETIPVKLIYSQENFVLPYNLYIIGTMNTADRSLGQIDYALRRRFGFLTIRANSSAIQSYYADKNMGLMASALKLFEKVRAYFGAGHGDGRGNVNSDFDPDDIMVGHSYFMAESKGDLDFKMRYELIPLLEEYRKDGILTCRKDEEAYEKLLKELGSDD
jgi:5-methylcytosine-specific restriction protein B